LTNAIIEIMGQRSSDEVDRFFYTNVLRTYRIAEKVEGL